VCDGDTTPKGPPRTTLTVHTTLGDLLLEVSDVSVGLNALQVGSG
jgi:hypothetical protein